MKVIHVILGKARPDRMNGVSKSAHYLMLYLTRLGFDAEMWGITEHPDPDLPQREYPLHQYRKSKYPFGISSELRKAISLLEPSETYVHIHGAFIPDFYSLARILKRRGIPYVYSPHGAFSPFALNYHGHKKRWYFRLYEASIIRHAHALHFLGVNQYEEFDSIMKIPHKRLILNGQDFEVLEEARNIYLPIENPEPIFSYCGRFINHYKALDELIKGFHQFICSGNKGRLWLIGDGPDRKKLEKLALNLCIAHRVTFWGPQYGEEKYRLLTNSDVFIHPSHSEGFPTALLEAAGLGLPCIVTPATNFGEFAMRWQSGVCIQQNDPIQISQAMQIMAAQWENGLLIQDRTRVSALVKQHFDWRRITDLTSKLYQNPLPDAKELETLALPQPLKFLST